MSSGKRTLFHNMQLLWCQNAIELLQAISHVRGLNSKETNVLRPVSCSALEN